MKERRRQVFADGSKSPLSLMAVTRKLVCGVRLRSELFGVLASAMAVMTMNALLAAAVALGTIDVEGCLAEALWLGF